MTLRRQRLSQRRKAVGLTQESLAQRLGVERSTVARWEAGYTEPLPSVRPDVARALQVSIEEFAELLTEPDNAGTTNAGTTQARSANAEVTMPVPLSKFQSEVWLGRAEFEDLIRPQVAETVETARSDGVRSDDVSTKDLAVAESSEESAVGAAIEPYQPATITVRARGCVGADVPDLSSVTTIPLNLAVADIQRQRTRAQQSKRSKRFAAAGILVLVGWAASVPFLTSNNDSITPAAGNQAPAVPVAAIPAPNPSSNESTGTPAAPNKPAEASVPSGAAEEPTSQTTRSDSRSKPPVSKRTPPQPRTPEIPAEVYTWSRMAEQFREYNQSRARSQREFSSYP